MLGLLLVGLTLAIAVVGDLVRVVGIRVETGLFVAGVTDEAVGIDLGVWRVVFEHLLGVTAHLGTDSGAHVLGDFLPVFAEEFYGYEIYNLSKSLEAEELNPQLASMMKVRRQTNHLKI